MGDGGADAARSSGDDAEFALVWSVGVGAGAEVGGGCALGEGGALRGYDLHGWGVTGW